MGYVNLRIADNNTQCAFCHKKATHENPIGVLWEGIKLWAGIEPMICKKCAKRKDVRIDEINIVWT